MTLILFSAVYSHFYFKSGVEIMLESLHACPGSAFIESIQWNGGSLAYVDNDVIKGSLILRMVCWRSIGVTKNWGLNLWQVTEIWHSSWTTINHENLETLFHNNVYYYLFLMEDFWTTRMLIYKWVSKFSWTVTSVRASTHFEPLDHSTPGLPVISNSRVYPCLLSGSCHPYFIFCHPSSSCLPLSQHRVFWNELAALCIQVQQSIARFPSTSVRHGLSTDLLYKGPGLDLLPVKEAASTSSNIKSSTQLSLQSLSHPYALEKS